VGEAHPGPAPPSLLPLYLLPPAPTPRRHGHGHAVATPWPPPPSPAPPTCPPSPLDKAEGPLLLPMSIPPPLAPPSLSVLPSRGRRRHAHPVDAASDHLGEREAVWELRRARPRLPTSSIVSRSPHVARIERFPSATVVGRRRRIRRIQTASRLRSTSTSFTVSRRNRSTPSSSRFVRRSTPRHWSRGSPPLRSWPPTPWATTERASGTVRCAGSHWFDPLPCRSVWSPVPLASLAAVFLCRRRRGRDGLAVAWVPLTRGPRLANSLLVANQSLTSGPPPANYPVSLTVRLTG